MADYRLPEDVKRTAISYVQGYERRKKEYNRRYHEIMDATEALWEEYTAVYAGKEVKCRAYENRRSGLPGKPTEGKALRLEKLRSHPDTVKMLAVEKAYDEIGERYGSSDIRQFLADGIMMNCRSGRKWNYEALNLPTITRKEFYKERRKFLWRVARYAELI